MQQHYEHKVSMQLNVPFIDLHFLAFVTRVFILPIYQSTNGETIMLPNSYLCDYLHLFLPKLDTFKGQN